MRLYSASLKAVTGLVNGESLRTFATELISTLTATEKYLVLAAYIASYNPAKLDLRLFGNASRKARIRKGPKATKVVEKVPIIRQVC